MTEQAPVYDTGTDERTVWLNERRKGIGGSDAAAVCGLNPYRSRVMVYLDKTGQIEDDAENERMHWGSVLEEPIAREYSIRTGTKIQRVNRILQHPDHAWMLANLDRRIVGQSDGPGVLECKTSDRFMAPQWGESGTDQVPEHYLLQVAHYLAVTGYTWARLAVLIGGNDFRVYTLPRDEELIGNLIEVERRFWKDHIEARRPPEPESADDAALLWPKDNGAAVLVDDRTLSAVRKLTALKDLIKRLEVAKSACELTIKRALGEHAAVLASDEGKPLLTWKTQKQSRIDSALLREKQPEIAKQFTKTTTVRVMRTIDKEIALL